MRYLTDIEEFYKRRNQRLKNRGKSVRFDYEKDSSAYDWITISGVHTPIDDNGNIAGGQFKGNHYTGEKMNRSAKRAASIGGVRKRKNLKPHGKRKWKFSLGTSEENKEVPAMVYPTKYGIEIAVPKTATPDKQHIRPEQIQSFLERIPASILKHAPKEIELVDYRNPYDSYWEKKYNMPNFRSFAIGGTDGITYFENSYKPDDIHTLGTLAHEIGHNVDRKIKEKLGRGKGYFSEGDEWQRACRMDQETMGDNSRWVSDYAKTSENYREDFADSVKKYVTNRNDFKHYYPNRFKLFEEMLANL